jgi:membrane protein implicated in regulation of membrane protease activity
MAASKAGLSFMVQASIFAVVSFALFILARPFVKKFLKGEEYHTNADRIIGMTAEVIEKVSFREPGAVKVDGKIWTAKSLKDDMVFEKGSMVMVVKIEGVTVYVK